MQGVVKRCGEVVVTAHTLQHEMELGRLLGESQCTLTLMVEGRHNNAKKVKRCGEVVTAHTQQHKVES